MSRAAGCDRRREHALAGDRAGADRRAAPPFSVTVLTELPAASSFKVSLLPVSVRISALVPPEVIAPVISKVPPLAVMCPADPLVPVTAAANTPWPVIVPAPIVAPLASVRVAPVPDSCTVPLPIAS
ncbi:MAG: hypothetical protein E6G81_14485 [Alphaproteobacteria bacterium]|nr:MAG: hypothetical protein E6G81_14485 [Alphaproteobacteria bacterium]